MDALLDDELLARTPSSPEAFAVFYRRHELLVLAYFQRRTRDPELAADLAAETFATALMRIRRHDRVAALLARLPRDQADAVRARILDEEPYAGIAARVHCSESAVRQRVSRGLAGLRRSIEESSP